MTRMSLGLKEKSKPLLKHCEWLPWLKEHAGVLGFETRQTASRLIGLALANGTSTYHLSEAEAAQLSRKTWGHTTERGTTGTGENEWYAPLEFIEPTTLALAVATRGRRD